MTTATVDRAAGAAPAIPADARPIPTRPAWLFGPKVDLIVGCGLWTIPMLLLVTGLGALQVFSVALVFYYLSMVCNYPHYMATIYRAYGTAEDFSKYRFFTVWATLAFLVMAVVTHWQLALLPLFFTIYLTWSPYHYTGQNYGLAMMFARRSGATPTNFDRQMLHAAFMGSYATMIVGMHSAATPEPFFLPVHIPAEWAYPIRSVSVAVFLICGGYSLIRLIRQTNAGAMAATITLFVTQFLWFVAPSFYELFFNAPPPTVYFTTGALAFMHCSQYLWVTTYYARRETEAGVRGANRQWNPRRYAFILIIGGLALFLPGPWIMSRLFHVDLIKSLLVFVALINIHHFMIDGAIWKLRDGRIAQLLLGKKADGTVQQGRVDAALTWAGRALMSPNPLARGARWAAVSGLFAIAAVDMLHTTLTTSGSPTLRAAELAYRINPYDSRAATMQANALAQEGRTNEALSWLQRALALNDRNVGALRMTGALLINGGSLDEAWEHYKTVEARVAPDIGTLVNIGLLARERGDAEEAEKRLRDAWRQDPENRQVILNLAELLLEKGEVQEAANAFGTYLELTPAELAQDPAERRTYLAAAMRLGEASVALGQVDSGLITIQETMKLAIHFAEWDFASKASSLIGTLLEEANRAEEALMYHQQAVTIAAESANPTDVARQWLNLGHFLERRGWDDRWTYLAFESAARRLDRSDLSAQRIAARRGVERLAAKLGAAAVGDIEANADALRIDLLGWSPSMVAGSSVEPAPSEIADAP